MAKELILVNSLYPKVEAALKKPNNLKNLIKHAQKYFDKNHEKVFDMTLTHKILFLMDDKEAIYDAIELRPEEIKSVIKQSEYIKDKWKIMNEPLNTASALILRYLMLNKKDDELKFILTYYSFYFYSSLFHKYLPYGANENIMEYTINNLSNKFLIKKLGSLYKCVEHIAMTSHETYSENLKKGEDGDLATYISALKVRLNDFLKNIKNEYTINHGNKNYVNFDRDSYDEENFHMSDNNSYAIKRAADSTMIRLTTSGADLKTARLAANWNSVSENEIRNVVLHLGHEDSDDIQRMCELILQLFLFEGKNNFEEVRTNKFLVKSMELYKKSNTNDKLILEIKYLLDKWLKKYGKKYTKTNREATLSYYRKAIFTYFVISIQQSS